MTPSREAGSHGADLARARTHVGPSAGSETFERPDHQGSVPEDERRLLEPFGHELRALRTASGLSQQRLGDLAGLRGDHVGRLERAQRRPTVGAVKALARILAEGPHRDDLEQRLAELAGDSLREGAERRKQRKENRQRRIAVRGLEDAQRKLMRTIRQQEATGQVVSGSLRRVAQQNADLVERLKAGLESDPEPIKGHAPDEQRGRRRRRLTKAEVLAWARSPQDSAVPNPFNALGGNHV